MDMQFLLSYESFAILGEIILLNIVLSGDNAVVIGLAAAGLPHEQRNKAILFGIIAATVLRIAFAAVAAQLLDFTGVTLIGGLLLVWIAWNMFTELRTQQEEDDAIAEGKALDHPHQNKTLGRALWQIVVADVSMSLDNVLAVAGAAHDYPILLYAGLVISILLMGAAASLIAKLLERYHWIAYLGLAVIIYVALEMIYDGGMQVWTALA